MSGTNTMCVVTVLLETGMLPMIEPVTELTLEAPAGLIRVRADCADGKVTAVTFRNVPAFATHLAAPVEVPHAGHGRRRRRVRRDVLRHRRRRAVRAEAHAGRGRRHRPDHRDDQGRRQRAAAGRPPGAAGLRRDHDRPAVRARPTIRPTAGGTSSRCRPARSTGSARRPGPGAIDRSPCGTGTSARMAILHARGRAARRRRRSATRASSARSSPAAWWRRPRSATVPGDRPDDHRPGLDHRLRRATWSTRPIRSPTVSRSATSGSAAGQRSQ